MEKTKTNYLNLYGLAGYNSEQIKIFARILKMEDGNPTILYDRRPDAAPNPVQYIQSMNIKEISYIVPDTFAGKTGIELLKNMNVEQLEKIGISDDYFLRLAIKNTFDRLLKLENEKNNPKTEKIRQYLAYSPTWQF